MWDSSADAATDVVRPSTLDPEWSDTSGGGAPIVSVGEPKTSPMLPLALLAAVLAIGALVLVASVSGAEVGPDADAAPQVPTTLPAPTPIVEPAIAVEPGPAPPQLGIAPAEWIEGFVVGFIDGENSFHLYDLESGESVVGKQWATFPWPPLTDDIRILGGRNISFGIDPTSPEDSGRISTAVHTVRLAPDDDIFGFFSRSDEGVEFFAGSQWGPANRGLIGASSRSDVFVVPGRGIVVSEPDASGQIIEFDGVSEVPSRLGRVVAASRSLLLGVHCDDFGRCVGRLADWDAEVERIIPADLAASATVSISPDGRHIIFGTATSWGVWDVESGTFRPGDDRALPNRSVSWSPERAVAWWLQDGVVVGVDAESDLQTFAAPIEDIDPQLRVSDDASLVVVSLFSKG